MSVTSGSIPGTKLPMAHGGSAESPPREWVLAEARVDPADGQRGRAHEGGRAAAGDGAATDGEMWTWAPVDMGTSFCLMEVGAGTAIIALTGLLTCAGSY